MTAPNLPQAMSLCPECRGSKQMDQVMAHAKATAKGE